MKKLIILVSIFSLGFGLHVKAQYIGAQDLPADISQDFTAKYPNLSKVEWEKDGKKYKATFNVENWAHQVVYNQNGQLISQEFGLPVSNLPSDVVSGLKKNFPDLQIEGVDQIVEKGHVSYKLSLKDDNNGVAKVLMAADGMVIRTIDEEN